MTPEMHAFEYSLRLFAVLIGLAVADVANSFHRLMRSRFAGHLGPAHAARRAATRCAWRSGMWFDLWGVRHFAATRHFFFYLWLIAEMFVLFLIAAAALPDEIQAPLRPQRTLRGSRAATSGRWSRSSSSPTW